MQECALSSSGSSSEKDKWIRKAPRAGAQPRLTHAGQLDSALGAPAHVLHGAAVALQRVQRLQARARARRGAVASCQAGAVRL